MSYTICDQIPSRGTKNPLKLASLTTSSFLAQLLVELNRYLGGTGSLVEAPSNPALFFRLQVLQFL